MSEEEKEKINEEMEEEQKKLKRQEISAFDAGRMGALVRRTNPELWDAIKRIAQQKGMKVSELISEAVKNYIFYEYYRDLDGATIMKCMDLLDRMYGYMNGWLEKTSLVSMVDTLKALEEITNYMAPRMGYVHQEELEEIKKKIKEETEKKIIEQYSRTGKIGNLIDRIIDKVSDELARAIVEKLDKLGVTEDLAKIAMNETTKAIKEEIEKG